MVAVVGVLSGVLGLILGSFLNVVIYRVPAGMSVVAPPSACPRCATPIKPIDNIPVLSWLMLRGRCRSCRTAISPRYPSVELGTAILFAVVAVVFSTGIDELSSNTEIIAWAIELAAFLYLAAITVALAMIDIDTHTLPNPIVLPSYAVTIVLLTAASLVGGDVDSLIRALVGGAALFAFYFVLLLVYPRGMGFGDVKLAGVLGLYLAWIGWGPLVVGGFAAFLLGGIFAIGLVLLRKADRKTALPFGPWMLAGAWIGILIGEPLANSYLTFVGLA
ncbi:prepilin peptidase [Leifsonia sp. YIM 134122]|uniref:Prepilin leader peptidase/N-methyltransferase n=1 Tax=Leifsonia stereocauli TaxID=3134136 RepID=A0ABU9W7W0_9MICO